MHAKRARNQGSPSDAPCPGIGEGRLPARDQIISLGIRMGEGALFLLKAGDSRPERSKQAEIRIAILLKILRIPPVSEAEGLPGRLKTCNGCICSDFRWIWLIRRN